MQANYSNYNIIDSDGRIQEILGSAEAFEELNDIPTRERLTFSNGFYVNCTALFIDIRDSSKLASNHTRPVLGKLYRSYLSECVAVMNGGPNCREVFIQGDCVSGIFNTPKKADIDSVFFIAAILNSMTQILNWRIGQKGYSQFLCGIGMAYGRALMLKAGFKGSGVNDIIWMGDVVNEASNLCHDGNRGGRKVLQVSTTIQSNLSAHNQALLEPVCKVVFPQVDQYQCDVVIPEMEQYLAAQRKQAEDARQLGLMLQNGLPGLRNQPPRNNWI